MDDDKLPDSPHEQADMQRKLEHLGIDCSKGLKDGFDTFLARFDKAPDDPWKALDEQGGSTFSEVFQFELAALTESVPERSERASLPDVYTKAHDACLSGLAFSGGGIRSATFNLGVIQALAQARLLADFDYLSTVSGGGYIGGWLSKWIHHTQGGVTQVQNDLLGAKAKPPAAQGADKEPEKVDPHKRPPRSEPRAVQYLRRYSNYMTPRTGMFSADTWTLICTYVRNTMLNMLILVAWLSAVFLLPRVLLPVVDPAFWDGLRIWPLAVGIFLVSVASIAFSISRKDRFPWRGWKLQGQGAVQLSVCLPLMLAGLIGSIALAQRHDYLAMFWNELPSSLGRAHAYMLVPGLCYFIAWGAGWTAAQWFNAVDAKGKAAAGDREYPQRSLRRVLREGSVHLASAAIALTAGTILLLKVNALVHTSEYNAVNVVRLATFGMPILLCLFGVTITLMIGLIGREYRDESREWWARQGAWTVIWALAWLGLFACTFYLPPLLDWAWHTYVTTTAVAGLLSTLLTLAGLKAGSGKGTGNGGTANWKDLVATIAPYAFSLLAIALLTTALQWLVAPVLLVYKSAQPPGDMAGVTFHSDGKVRCVTTPGSAAYDKVACTLQLASGATEPAGRKAALPDYLDWYTDASSRQCVTIALHTLKPGQMATCRDRAISAGWLLCWALVAAFVLSWRVDINKFSLYMMYRLRLVRAYLGASTPERAPHPFTGFDPQDDPPLAALLKTRTLEKTAEAEADKAAAPPPAKVQRPYHLINAAVNLVGGKELAWQNRKAGNFVFSPAFCGFELPRMPDNDNRRPQLRGAFRPTGQYAADEATLRSNDAGVKLGTAVAVSGAAASPNMGYHSSLPLAFLMTLFNLRLGRWSPNPMRKDLWRRPAPYIGLFSIISELLGQTDSTARFLYLSDGGHFENLGIYELVRRRCKLIIAVDASADTTYAFDDLGNAVRKCLTDFNVPIELNPSGMRRLDKENTSAVCFVTGKIHYGQADEGAGDGVLLYIKPTIVGTENADLLNYSRVNAAFPHQSTADQWFDESQFESYRVLGLKAGTAALEAVVAGLASGGPVQERKERIARICEVLDRPPKPDGKGGPGT